MEDKLLRGLTKDEEEVVGVIESVIKNSVQDLIEVATCIFCKYQKAIKDFLDELDDLEIIGASLYDDAICEMYNNADTVHDLLSHEHDDKEC